MKKSLGLLLGSVALGSILVAQLNAAYANSTVEVGTLSIGIDLTYPPYDYMDGGNPAGFDVEVVQAIAERMKLKTKFLDTRFENLILGVRGSQFDVIASMLYVKPDRAKQIEFIPYVKTGVSIAATAKSGLSFATFKDLCGHVVGSIKGAAWLEEIAKLNKTDCKDKQIDSREFPTSPEATQALLSGNIDAQIDDSAFLAVAAKKVSGRVKITSAEQLYPVVVGLGVRKDNSLLADEIRKALKELKADGSYDALLKAYNVAKPSDEEFKAAIGE